MPPLGHQGKLIIQSVGDMFHYHNQALHDRFDKQDKWHKKMYETLSRATSNFAYRQDMLWESVANLEGLMRDLLAHPAMQERHRSEVAPPEIQEMPPWDKLPIIPPPQGNGGLDLPVVGEFLVPY